MNGGLLVYTGGGEIVQRPISMLGNGTIESSGSGPLVLTNVTMPAGGAKQLALQGISNDANRITSALADNVSALRIFKTDSGTWELTGNNTFTGGVRVDSGFLGLANSSSAGSLGPVGLVANAVGASATITLSSGTTAGLTVGMTYMANGTVYGDTITGITNSSSFTVSRAVTVAAGSPLVFGGILLSNAGLYATDPVNGLTLAQPVMLNANTSGTFTGAGSITLTGKVYGDTGNPWNIINLISTPSTLNLNSDFYSFENATARTLTIYGTGNTNLNNTFTSLGGQMNLAFNTAGTVTFGGSPSSGLLVSTTVVEGRIVNSRPGTLNPFGVANGAGTGFFAMHAGSLESTVSLAGANAIVLGLRLDSTFAVITGGQSIEFAGNATAGYSLQQTAADRILTNNLATGATLTFSGQPVQMTADAVNRTLTLAGTGAYVISNVINNGGTATASAFRYSGSGSLGLTGISTFAGSTTFNGGVTTLSTAGGQLLNTTGVTVANGATLTLDNVAANASAPRLSNKPVALTGAILNFLGNSAGIDRGHRRGCGHPDRRLWPEHDQQRHRRRQQRPQLRLSRDCGGFGAELYGRRRHGHQQGAIPHDRPDAFARPHGRAGEGVTVARDGFRHLTTTRAWRPPPMVCRRSRRMACRPRAPRPSPARTRRRL